MVVGIFQDAGSIKPVVDALKSGGADLERLRVLTVDEIPTELASTEVEFVWIGDVERASSPGTLGTGTGLPGIGSRSPNEVHGDELLESLSEFGIPDGRTDDYAQAVEQGRVIMGYPASDQVRQIFASAGAAKIDEF